MDNYLRLNGLDIIREYNGYYYKDLSDDVQNKILDCTLRTFELSPDTPKDLMFTIFERLNTGGIALNEMEIRNCLYRGGLNNLIRDLAKNDNFRTCLKNKNIARRMTDRLLVLRFLAFYERTHKKARTGLKHFLNDYFTTYRNPPPEKLQEYEREFKKAVQASLTIFGENSFRLLRDLSKGGGEWATRTNSCVFQIISTSFTNYKLEQLTRQGDAIFEEYIDLISTDEKWVKAVTVATGEYFNIEYSFDTWAGRLSSALSNSEPNDSNRCFSKELKKEMYNQNPTCAICGQNITLLMDAAMDHDTHYWRGGKTVPENARLVHRYCNLKRNKDD